jgi:hypothetical protein
MGTNANGHNGDGGRRPDGTFAPGHAHSRKPRRTRAARLRAALVKAVTRDDVAAIIAKQVELAKAGDPQAAKLVLDRVMGKVSNSDVIERIEALERLFQERNANGGRGKWN